LRDDPNNGCGGDYNFSKMAHVCNIKVPESSSSCPFTTAKSF